MAVALEVTAQSDTDPCPRVEVTITGITGEYMTLTRNYGTESSEVRGALKRETTGTSFIIDYEVPLGIPVTYGVTGLDASGNIINALTKSAAVTVWPQLYDGEMAWMQDPLDPTTAMRVILEGKAGTSLGYSRTVEYNRPLQSTIMGMAGRMGEAENVPWSVYTRYGDETARFLKLVRDAYPLVIRTIDPIPLPPLVYASVDSVNRNQVDLDRAGWELWAMEFTTVRASSAAIVKPVYTYGSVIRLHEGYTYADVIAAHPGSYLDIIRHPEPGA